MPVWSNSILIPLEHRVVTMALGMYFARQFSLQDISKTNQNNNFYANWIMGKPSIRFCHHVSAIRLSLSITGHFQSPQARYNNIAQDLIKPGLGESHDKVLGAALVSHYFVSDLSENTWKLSMKLPVTDLWHGWLNDRCALVQHAH